MSYNVDNGEAYSNFQRSLEEYKEITKQLVIKRKDYRNGEKNVFKYLQIVISGNKLPPKKSLYEKLFDMFNMMLICRSKCSISGKKSLFYDLLKTVCGIEGNSSLTSKIKAKKNEKIEDEKTKKVQETEKILKNINKNESVYNQTKRKIITAAVVGGVVVGATIATGGLGTIPAAAATGAGAFFAGALSKLPIGTVVDTISGKSRIDIGYASMPIKLWKLLGSLPSKYDNIEKNKRIRKRKKHSKIKKHRKKNKELSTSSTDNEKDDSLSKSSE